jgi:hypothetical protein
VRETRKITHCRKSRISTLRQATGFFDIYSTKKSNLTTMTQFPKEVLRHSCAWTTTEEDCRKITGFPEKTALNVNEGYEVLHFVCRYMAYKGWGAQATFQNIESAIKTRLPFGVQTHSQIKEWLDANYRK